MLRPGIAGGSSISMQRRAHDARFATRYFVGSGIDVGGAYDPLENYRELFPLIKDIKTYDLPDGDGQFLVNVSNNTFGFLYSSHCLEHLRDPYEAMKNWVRVVKPGGYLIVSVPDEDLYEQGVWPSTFNPDHKYTFTINKKQSWSPVSINLFDLIAELGSIKPISIMTIDHAFLYKEPRLSFPQTVTGLSECAIEFILKKE